MWNVRFELLGTRGIHNYFPNTWLFNVIYHRHSVSVVIHVFAQSISPYTRTLARQRYISVWARRQGAVSPTKIKKTQYFLSFFILNKNIRKYRSIDLIVILWNAFYSEKFSFNHKIGETHFLKNIILRYPCKGR